MCRHERRFRVLLGEVPPATDKLPVPMQPLFTPNLIPNFEAIRVVGSWASEDFCAIHADFSFSCWGANTGGKFTSDALAKETPVTLNAGLEITDLSIGYDFMCFTEELPNSKWETVCQGDGQYGQLGSE